MGKSNPSVDKSYALALRIIRLHHYLLEKHEYDLAREVLRCGTAVGQHVEEAVSGESPENFTTQMAVAYKEGRKTRYWIRLLRDSHLIDDEAAQSVLEDIEELNKILFTIKRTSSVQSSPNEESQS
ncbi:four helix bundle protein [Candidatus Sumerlaeota bacterium]|nr:four helix bundle protein [Candidatus Sumerlaeota bacterium]